MSLFSHSETGLWRDNNVECFIVSMKYVSQANSMKGTLWGAGGAGAPHSPSTTQTSPLNCAVWHQGNFMHFIPLPQDSVAKKGLGMQAWW